MSNFVHLHGHTEYSLLDGLSKIKKLVKTVKEMGMSAVAITDHGSMYGAIEFYKECVKQEIKPIIGCEFYVAKRSHKDKEGKLDTEPYHLTVLAKNYQGYLNLMKLVSVAHLDGYYYKPRVDRELLKQYHEGLIAFSGCPAGEFIRNLSDGSFKGGEEVAKSYLEIFGEGNYYFELMNHESSRLLQNPNLDPLVRQDLERLEKIQKRSLAAVKELSGKLGIPVVATNDFHYINLDDAPAQDALVCVQTGKFIKDIQRLRMIDLPTLYIRPPEEMSGLFSEISEAVSNTVKVAEQINLEITLGKPIFPIFDIPGGLTDIEYFKKLVLQGFEAKFSNPKPEYIERLEYELKIIEEKNFVTYILIVNDFIHWAHEQRIITNTRGSAAGSLVLYSLGITNTDPVESLIPFERFLNPLRPKLPDIDSDIADDRRDDVIKYITEKYGQDKVAQIITFGTMMGRAAIRDIGRVLGMPYGDVDRIAKLVPPPKQGFHQSLEEVIKEVAELAQLYKEDPQVKTLLDLAKKVETTVRHASVHAAGLVISPTNMTDFTPLQKESNGDRIISQYDMFSISEDYEGVGLIKLDLLGIRNLSILGHAVDIVKQNRGVSVDLNNLPLDDEQSSIHPELPPDGCKKTFELLGRGETMGLFQLEGAGMTKYLTELKPTSIFDISAMIALYRPGPLGIIPDYIARKNNTALIEYFDPRMKAYMERSLGLLVYQEDVLYTTIHLAGYDWAEADKFRKAMGKKKPEEMAKEKKHFVTGCVTNGMEQSRAEELFAAIEKFAAYGFNKAHSASYAMVSYQTGYMKANFPVEFMTAVMTAEYGDSEKIAHAMDECKRMGITVCPPDVNKSKVGFAVENLEGGAQGIRFGMSAIKNVGVLAIESILKARVKGEFKSLADLASRADNRLVNKKALESLIKAGALDNLGSRAAHLLVLDQVLEKAHQLAKKTSNGQVGLFGGDNAVEEIVVKLPDVEELSLDQLLGFEKELLGFYLHEPPHLNLIKQAQQYCSYKLSDLTEELAGHRVVVAGVITQAKKIITKKSNSEMAFVKLSDTLAEMETVVFPTVFQNHKAILETDKVVILCAKLDKREDTLSLIADKFVLFNPENFDPESININSGSSPKYSQLARPEGGSPKSSPKEKEIEISVPKDAGVDVLQKVNKTLREFPGKQKVALLLPNGGNNLKRMDLPFGIKLDETLLTQLETLLGKGAVRLT